MILSGSIVQYLQYVEFEKKQSKHTLINNRVYLTQFENYITQIYQITQI